MFDIEAAVESRRQRLREAGLGDRHHGDADTWHYAKPDQLHRRWLALYRSEHWSLERIAALDGATIAQVWCGIVLAMRHEPRHRHRRAERRRTLRAG